MARPDPPAGRFKPDPDLLVHAHNDMLSGETERERFVRHRWEEAFSAVKVALAALRELYPSERDELPTVEQTQVCRALECVTEAYCELDDMSKFALGEPMLDVLCGHVRSIKEYDDKWNPSDAE